jgi:hypothetical protein
MKFRKIIRYFLPVVPFACLGTSLLIVSATMTIPPDNSHLIQSIEDVDTISEPENSQINETQPTRGIQNVEDFTGVSRTSFLSIFKDISLVVASGIIALTSAYIGAVVQGIIKEEEENRSERRKEIQQYRNYLHDLLRLSQQYSFIKRYPNLKARLANSDSNFNLTPNTIAKVIENMPLSYELSGINDDLTKRAYDNAIDGCINFLMDIHSDRELDYEKVRQDYLFALDALKQYESN